MFRVKDLREQHFILLHFNVLFNTEIGSVDKACRKKQVPYWVLDQIAHLCVAVYSVVCSLLSSYMSPEEITHQSYSISEGLYSGILRPGSTCFVCHFFDAVSLHMKCQRVLVCKGPPVSIHTASQLTMPTYHVMLYIR